MYYYRLKHFSEFDRTAILEPIALDCVDLCRVIVTLYKSQSRGAYTQRLLIYNCYWMFLVC